MDRRQKKTRKAIFNALNNLLQNNKFENITVQQIIDNADIGRSTFYAHFETKDDLLHAICLAIFEHIINDELPEEAIYKSYDELESLELKLGHLLYHLKNNNANIKGILKSESSTIFIISLKKYLLDLFNKYIHKIRLNIPNDFLINCLVGSFVETIRWYLLNDISYTPKEVAHFYITFINK